MDGGPAFPTKGGMCFMLPAEFPEPEMVKEVVGAQYHGMTLRDYFAGRALVALSASFVERFSSPDDDLPSTTREFSMVIASEVEDVAALAYDIADAMLRARKGGAA